MEALIVICLVWLVILQITVNRLEDQLSKFSSNDTKDSAPTEPAQPETALPAPVEEPAISPQSVPTPAPEPEPVFEQPSPAPKPAFEFTAAKLFSWIGGFMLFLGCVWAIKYVVDNNLLNPLTRIILSIGVGTVLAVCGFMLRNEK